MKPPKTKEDLIERVVEQIKEDVHCGYYESMEGLLELLSTDDLIEFLPEENWKQFKHLREPAEEIRTENAITNLITQFPNDMELGKEIRKRWQKK